MSTKRKKTKAEMIDEICGPADEAATQKDAEEWYNSNVEPANPSLDNAVLIDQIEYGLYAIAADAEMLMKMLDRLREKHRLLYELYIQPSFVKKTIHDEEQL